MADIFDSYRLAEAWDEMFAAPGQPRRPYNNIISVLPWRLIYTSPRFRREVADFTPPNDVRVHVAGIDLVRDEAGQFRVLEDNVRCRPGSAT